MKTYFGEPGETARVLSASGWLDTGDLGYRLDGQIVITGRAKDCLLYTSSRRKTVLLPAPEGPTRATRAPGFTCRLKPFSAGWSARPG